MHGAGYQALIMVDNSQGHSAYAKDSLLIPQMNIRPLETKLTCTMDGIFKMVKKSFNQWSSHLITQHSWISPMGSKPFSGSMVYSMSGFMENTSPNVIVTRMTVATSASWSVSKISTPRNHLSKKSLKLQDICASFCPNFIVSLCNFIEVFWCTVKKYFCNNCDYTFANCNSEGKYAQDIGHCATPYDPLMGALDGSVDGGLQVGFGH